MRSVHRVPAVLLGVVGIIFLPAFQVVAESIYYWKDRNGIPCYSNTNIPRGTTEFSVMRAAWSATPQADGFDVTDDVDAGENDMPAAAGSEAVIDSRVAALRDRIERRQASIQHIEKILKTYPDDANFRRSLYKKKQCLHEDITRLELLIK